MMSSPSPKKERAKSKTPKVCLVCGDVAKSFHFGGLSCDSCKAFFRRSVYKDQFMTFKCSSPVPCQVTKTSRKICQSCRYNKCVSIGMEKSWVMSEDERTKLNKQRQEKRQSSSTTSSPEKKGEKSAETQQQNIPGHVPGHVPGQVEGDKAEKPDVMNMLNHMTIEDQQLIENTLNFYYEGYAKIPYNVDMSAEKRTPIETIKMFTTILRRLSFFASKVPEFKELGKRDKITLLRGSILEQCMLRSAIAFDAEHNVWPKSDSFSILKNCPQLKLEQMHELVSDHLFELHLSFIKGIQELNVDEATIMLLLVIVLFTDRDQLLEIDKVNKAQERYLNVLEKYMRWRYPFGTYPKLLTKLVQLRELNDHHTEYHLKLSSDDIVEIRRSLSRLNINPYPLYEIIPLHSDSDLNLSEVDDEQPDEEQSSKNPSLPMPMHIPTSLIPPQFASMLPQTLGIGGLDSNLLVQSMSKDLMQTFFKDFVHKTIPQIMDTPEEPLDAGFYTQMMGQMGQMMASQFGSPLPLTINIPENYACLQLQNMDRNLPIPFQRQFPPPSSTVTRYYDPETGQIPQEQEQQNIVSTSSASASASGSSGNLVESTTSESLEQSLNLNEEFHFSGDLGLSQIKNFLETLGDGSSDPQVLQQIKDSLTPAAIQRLKYICATPDAGTGSSSTRFQIPLPIPLPLPLSRQAQHRFISPSLHEHEQQHQYQQQQQQQQQQHHQQQQQRYEAMRFFEQDQNYQSQTENPPYDPNQMTNWSQGQNVGQSSSTSSTENESHSSHESHSHSHSHGHYQGSQGW